MDERFSIEPSLPRDNPTKSYWQEPPDSISNLRSTESLPNEADYVIVGSGISGAMIAWGILGRKPEAKVVMIEARGAVSGATGRNGMCCDPLFIFMLAYSNIITFIFSYTSISYHFQLLLYSA
jgi:hypothetical protein